MSRLVFPTTALNKGTGGGGSPQPNHLAAVPNGGGGGGTSSSSPHNVGLVSPNLMPIATTARPNQQQTGYGLTRDANDVEAAASQSQQQQHEQLRLTSPNSLATVAEDAPQRPLTPSTLLIGSGTAPSSAGGTAEGANVAPSPAVGGAGRIRRVGAKGDGTNNTTATAAPTGEGGSADNGTNSRQPCLPTFDLATSANTAAAGLHGPIITTTTVLNTVTTVSEPTPASPSAASDSSSATDDEEAEELDSEALRAMEIAGLQQAALAEELIDIAPFTVGPRLHPETLQLLGYTHEHDLVKKYYRALLLLRSLLRKEPNSRPTAAEAFNHKFFTMYFTQHVGRARQQQHAAAVAASRRASVQHYSMTPTTNNLSFGGGGGGMGGGGGFGNYHYAGGSK